MTLAGWTSVIGPVAALLVASAGASAQPVESFYRGKTITLIVGAGAGGAYDLVGRALAGHLARHIPGEPLIVIQNMPGAASLVMVNHLYNRAARDGTVMGLPLNGILLEPRFRLYSGTGSNVMFELGKMSWIGSPSQQPQVVWAWHSSPIKQFSDLQSKPTKFGATSPSADNYTLPVMINKLMAGKIDIITGYNAVTDIFVAAERGEIDGNTTPLSSITSGKPDALRDGRISVVAQFGSKRVAALPEVPTGIELAKDDATRRLLEIYALKFRPAYPLALPPLVPSDRVKALQDAFAVTMKDPDFIKTAARSGIEVSPTLGDEIANIIEEINRLDAVVIDKLRSAMSVK